MPAQKPTALKALQGTLRADRTNPNEPKITDDISVISPPKLMTKGAKELWIFAINQMPQNMVMSLDFGCFERWCMLQDQFHTMCTALNKQGVVLVDDEGNTKINPLQNSIIKLSAELRGIEVQLGFTPASRSKVVLNNTKEETKNGFLDL